MGEKAVRPSSPVPMSSGIVRVGCPSRARARPRPTVLVEQTYQLGVLRGWRGLPLSRSVRFPILRQRKRSRFYHRSELRLEVADLSLGFLLGHLASRTTKGQPPSRATRTLDPSGDRRRTLFLSPSSTHTPARIGDRGSRRAFWILPPERSSRARERERAARWSPGLFETMLAWSRRLVLP